MARAKLDKENAAQGVYVQQVNKDENDKFFKEMSEKANKRFDEKKNNQEHDVKVDVLEKTEVDLQNEKFNREGAEKYQQKEVAERLKGMDADKILAEHKNKRET